MKSYEQIRNDRLKIIGILLLCFAALIYLVPVSDAKVNPNSTLSVIEILDTESSITWQYNYTVFLTYASLDGVTIEGFDLKSVNYTAFNLEPESKHEFCINSATGRNCEIGHTSAKVLSSSDLIIDFVYQYMLVFLAIILMLIGFRIPLCSIIAFLFAFIGFLQAIQSHDFYFLMINIVVLIGSTMITYTGVKK
jgi:hypothetical protein